MKKMDRIWGSIAGVWAFRRMSLDAFVQASTDEI